MKSKLPRYFLLPDGLFVCQRTQFRCKDCGHGMHCLYLEDLYKDRKIHESGKLEELRQARAISQQSGRGSNRRSKKKSNKKPKGGKSTFSAKVLDTDELGCTWTDCESDDEGQTKKSLYCQTKEHKTPNSLDDRESGRCEKES